MPLGVKEGGGGGAVKSTGQLVKPWLGVFSLILDKALTSWACVLLCTNRRIEQMESDKLACLRWPGV